MLHPIICVSIWLTVSSREAIQMFVVHSAHPQQCSWSDTILPDMYLCAFSLQFVVDFCLQNLLLNVFVLSFFYQIVGKITGKIKNVKRKSIYMYIRITGLFSQILFPFKVKQGEKEMSSYLHNNKSTSTHFNSSTTVEIY